MGVEMGMQMVIGDGDGTMKSKKGINQCIRNGKRNNQSYQERQKETHDGFKDSNLTSSDLTTTAEMVMATMTMVMEMAMAMAMVQNHL